MFWYLIICSLTIVARINSGSKRWYRKWSTKDIKKHKENSKGETDNHMGNLVGISIETLVKQKGNFEKLFWNRNEYFIFIKFTANRLCALVKFLKPLYLDLNLNMFRRHCFNSYRCFKTKSVRIPLSSFSKVSYQFPSSFFEVCEKYPKYFPSIQKFYMKFLKEYELNLH